jgi:glycosyltransferase involved in cell wall biosynthesis
MSTPVFSVVIPAYNAPRTIESCVRSVLAQTRSDFELIVVDDGSTDDTADRVQALASEDPRIELIRQENRGTAGARNTGIARARGRYVSFLDNDDLWMPNYLEQMHRALEADPSAGMAYTDGWNLGDSNRKIRRLTSLEHYPPVSPTASDEEFLVSLIDINFITSSTTVRRHVLEEVGGFDPTIRGSDDWDLWLRIVTRGYRAVRATGMLHIQRDRPGSQSRDELMMLRGMRMVLIRALDEYDLTPRARATGERRLRNIDRRIGWLAGESVPLRVYYGSRRRVGNLVRWALDWRQWRSTPPEEVTAAFPDLSRV